MTTHCVECSGPWGVLLDRGEEPTEENIAASRAELVAEIRDRWEDDYEPDELAAVDWDALPAVKAERVVFVSKGLWDFIDNMGKETWCEPESWYPLAECDIPSWLLKGRKQRWAVRWDCCNIGGPSFYTPVMEAQP